MRAFRTRKREEQNIKEANYITDEAKEAWRKQRTQNRKGETQ